MTQQQLLPSQYNNRSLFSDFYLGEMVKDDPHWQKIETQAWELRQRVANVLEGALPGLTEDTPEAEVERRLIRPVLDILGHHYYVQENVHTPEGQKFPDYGFFASEADRIRAETQKGRAEFYNGAVAVGEAKRWDRPLDRRIKGPGDAFTNHNPSYQIDCYLRATDKRWGILTNGRLWRLYQRDLSYRLDVYYEVNLPELLKLDAQAFLYFASFFSRDAFVPDATGQLFLDRAYSDSLAYAASLGDELKDNVYEALRLLTEGFLKLPASKLTPAELDIVRENAFTTIYRLLFIFYSESPRKGEFLLPMDNPTYRDIYSLRALSKEIADRLDANSALSPTATSYWARLQELFRLINEGDQHLGVHAYNGGLFDDSMHPFLAEKRVGDSYLAGAIDFLARATAAGRTGRGFVAYGDLGVRELGSIYEGLLEQRPRNAEVPMVVIRDGKAERVVPEGESKGKKPVDRYDEGQVYLTLHRGERKATGSYYTPEYIVKYIVQNTLGPLIEDMSRNGKDLLDTDEGIFSLRVLDPSMGSGHFLVEATDYLARALVEALGGKPQEMEEEEIRWARREVVERCVYGVDLNPLAVELAKLSLWLHTVSRDKPLNFLDHHLRCGNSLIGGWVKDLGVLPEPGKKGKAPVAGTTLAGHTFSGAVAAAVNSFYQIMEAPSETIEDIHRKEGAYETARYALQRIKDIADVWTSVFFGNGVPVVKERGSVSYESLLQLAESGEGDWPTEGEVAWLGRARELAKANHFFHWELEFPEVFFDRNGQLLPAPGFTTVVGNPPYDVMEKERLGSEDPHAQIAHYIESVPDYYPALGGKVNLFRPFMVQEIRLLRDGGVFGKIVPLAIANDFSCTRPRVHFLTETSLVKLECFPQKDDPRDRVFEDAKLSTCIPILRKLGSTTSFTVRIHPGRQFANDCKRVHVSLAEMQAIDPGVLPIPLVTQLAWDLCVRVHTRLPVCHISDLATLTRGEINQTIFANFITSNPFHQEMIKGVEIDRYSEHWYLSQGEKQWFDESLYYRMTTYPKKIPNFRIGIQRITGIDDRIRLIGTFVNRRVYFADSTNSIATDDPSKLYFLLALINSQFFNWRFKLTSSNNNVATNELDRLPVRRINFNTPPAERTRLAIDAKALYEQRIIALDFSPLQDFVGDRLPRKSDGLPDWERDQSDVVYDLLAFLTEEMIRLHKEKQAEVRRFLSWLESYLGVSVDALKNKTRVKEYWKPEASWDKFRDALVQNRRTITKVTLPGYQTEQPIREGFDGSRAKLQPLLNRIQRTDWLIDQIVYRLYGLTEDEVAIVEGRA